MKKDFRKNIIGLIIVFTFIIFFLFKHKDKDENLKKSGRYTVGYVKDIFGMKGGRACEYEIIVDGKSYIQSNYLGSSNPKKDKYFVIFDPREPENNLIFLEIPVPDSLINYQPKNGWQTIPIEYNQNLYDLEFK